jgi:hypothetical protein
VASMAELEGEGIWRGGKTLVVDVNPYEPPAMGQAEQHVRQVLAFLQDQVCMRKKRTRRTRPCVRRVC